MCQIHVSQFYVSTPARCDLYLYSPQGKTRVVLNIKAIANFSSQLFATNVAFKIPVREDPACVCARLRMRRMLRDILEGALTLCIVHSRGGINFVYRTFSLPRLAPEAFAPLIALAHTYEPISFSFAPLIALAHTHL